MIVVVKILVELGCFATCVARSLSLLHGVGQQTQTVRRLSFMDARKVSVHYGVHAHGENSEICAEAVMCTGSPTAGDIFSQALPVGS